MRGFLKSKYFWLVVFLILFVVCAIAYEYLSDKNRTTSIDRVMTNCPKTVFERKESDGSVTEYWVHGDPVFHGEYPYERTYEIIDKEIDQTQWLYRVTYYNQYAGKEKIVFLFGYDWFSQDGVVYEMKYMTEFVYGLHGLSEYYDELSKIIG
jgi:hypothetical protein